MFIAGQIRLSANQLASLLSFSSRATRTRTVPFLFLELPAAANPFTRLEYLHTGKRTGSVHHVGQRVRPRVKPLEGETERVSAMGEIKVSEWRVEYIPTEDGDRDVQSEFESVITFDSPAECAEYMTNNGITEPSSYPDFHHTMWFSETYDNPYTGNVIETSVHRDESRTSEADWRLVWELLTNG